MIVRKEREREKIDKQNKRKGRSKELGEMGKQNKGIVRISRRLSVGSSDGGQRV